MIFPEIKMQDKYFKLVIQGKKSSTIRKGCKFYSGDSLIVNSNGNEKVMVYVDRVELVEFRHLQPIHAKKDGFGSLAELKVALGEIYGEINPNQIMAVIHF